MVDTPFQQPQALNVRQNRALALAGVFQAAQLTHMTAMTGQQSIGESGNFYFEQLIKALSKYTPCYEFQYPNIGFFSSACRYFTGFKNARK